MHVQLPTAHDKGRGTEQTCRGSGRCWSPDCDGTLDRVNRVGLRARVPGCRTLCSRGSCVIRYLSVQVDDSPLLTLSRDYRPPRHWFRVFLLTLPPRT